MKIEGTVPVGVVTRGLAVLMIALLVAGCAARSVQLKVENEVPAPIISKLPLDIGAYYDAEFSNHVYVENSEERPDWRIESGESQVALFDQIFSSLFASFERLDGVSAPAGRALDLVVAPKVSEMQFSTPGEIYTDFYEAWIKYELSIYEPDGSLLTTWSFVGYGKSSTAFMKNTDAGLNEAMNVALRDAGAKISINFKNIPEIKDLLEGK
jgi:hypothetical protein